MVNFEVFGILGLVFIILGTLMLSSERKIQRKRVYIFLLFGGAFLLSYSIYIKDLIFIILQAIYILIVIYDIIKLKFKRK